MLLPIDREVYAVLVKSDKSLDRYDISRALYGSGGKALAMDTALGSALERLRNLGLVEYADYRYSAVNDFPLVQRTLDGIAAEVWNLFEEYHP